MSGAHRPAAPKNFSDFAIPEPGLERPRKRLILWGVVSGLERLYPYRYPQVQSNPGFYAWGSSLVDIISIKASSEPNSEYALRLCSSKYFRTLGRSDLGNVNFQSWSCPLRPGVDAPENTLSCEV